MCGWSNYPGDDDGMDWIWSSGGTPGRFTGPRQDHTSGNGEGLLISLMIKESQRMWKILY